jgi:hypothetical protein
VNCLRNRRCSTLEKPNRCRSSSLTNLSSGIELSLSDVCIRSKYFSSCTSARNSYKASDADCFDSAASWSVLSPSFDFKEITDDPFMLPDTERRLLRVARSHWLDDSRRDSEICEEHDRIELCPKHPLSRCVDDG